MFQVEPVPGVPGPAACGDSDQAADARGKQKRLPRTRGLGATPR